MKKLLVVGIGLLLSVVSKADGIEAAEKVCSGLLYANEKQECLGVVNKATSLSEKAVDICGNLLYAKEKIECLTAIRDLNYTDTAIQTCGDMLYAKDKISCLSKAGRVNRKKDENVDKAYIRSSLRKALSAIRDRDDRKAEQILENLIDTL